MFREEFQQCLVIHTATTFKGFAVEIAKTINNMVMQLDVRLRRIHTG